MKFLLHGAVLTLVFCTTTVYGADSPCTTATPTCTEMVGPAATKERTLIYRTHSLDTPNESITRALIVVHGLGREATNYYRYAIAAAELADGLKDTLVIVPRFASNVGKACNDQIADGELIWQCQPRNDTWRTGGTAVNAKVTSFDIADEILRKLNRRETFPNLKAIVVAGHSAGGQFVSRYVMANQVHDNLKVKPTYVVANPSSYTYLDALRPKTATPPAKVVAEALPPTTVFTAFAEAESCASYDTWPYGLKNREGYAARIGDEALKKQVAARPTTFIVGERDVLPVSGFDGSCAAMAQGDTRVARGLAYTKYLNEKFAARHKSMVVPVCGHEARCMFTAESVLPLLFPNPNPLPPEQK